MLPKKMSEFNIRTLRTIGIWNPYIYCIQVFSMSVFIVPHLVHIYRNASGLEETTESILPTSSAILSLGKYIILFYKRNELAAILASLQSEWERCVLHFRYRYRDKFVMEANRNSQKLCAGYLILMLTVTIAFIIYPCVVTMYEKILGVYDGDFNLPFKGDFIIDTSKDPAHTIVSVVMIVCSTSSSIAVSGGDCIFVTITLHVVAHIKSLQRNLRSIGKVKLESQIYCKKGTTKTKRGQQSQVIKKDTEEEEDFAIPAHFQEDEDSSADSETFTKDKYLTEAVAFKQLKACIARHTQIIGYVDQLEDIFSHQFTLQFISSSLTICLIIFQLALNVKNLKHVLKLLFYLTGSTFQLYMLAWNGQNLLNETFKISEAAYDCPWYHYSPKFRKSILLVIMNSQKPLGISASKFYAISIANFAKIINAAGSYFTLLKGLKNK